MNKKFIMFVWITLLTFFSLQPVKAAGEVEYTLERNITSITPIFMTGHLGDLDWVEGFLFEGNIFLKGNTSPVGSYTADASLLNPPMNPTEVYDVAFFKMESVLPGIGSFHTTGTGIALGSSTPGDTTFAWSASISNGTGALLDSYGLSAGNGVVNIFTATGKITDVLNIRTGF